MDLNAYLIIFAILNGIAVLAARFIPRLTSPVLLLLAPVSMFTGSQDDMSIQIGMVFYFYGLVCFILAIITQFRKIEESY